MNDMFPKTAKNQGKMLLPTPIKYTFCTLDPRRKCRLSRKETQMKKDKKKFKEAFFEGLLEIVLTLIFFGIGALVVSAFGVELDSPNIDFDLIILLGIIVPVVVFGLVCTLIQWLKKIIKDKQK